MEGGRPSNSEVIRKEEVLSFGTLTQAVVVTPPLLVACCESVLQWYTCDNYPLLPPTWWN